MSVQTSQMDVYTSPKGISQVLDGEKKLKVSADYIRAIRQEVRARNDTLFVNGMARPSDIFAWLQKNPRFGRWKQR